MERYRLITRKGKELDIIINEVAKKDFKEMMEWDELDWNHNTKLMKPHASELPLKALVCSYCGKSMSKEELDIHVCKKKVYAEKLGKQDF